MTLSENFSSKARILVVEDESMLRETLVQILNMSDLDATGAENGKIALDLLNQQSFDLVLSDVQMPVMGGVELLRNIQVAHPGIKLVFFSAFADLSRAKAVEMGALDLLFKPLGIETLIEKIQSYLHLKVS
jgi:two-component system response regulator FlrC